MARKKSRSLEIWFGDEQTYICELRADVRAPEDRPAILWPCERVSLYIVSSFESLSVP
jgi:hypothetical protein